MSSTGYEEVRTVTQEEVAQFEMPIPEVGQCVVWHPRGLRNDTAKSLCWVMRISGSNRGIDMKLVSGVVQKNVPHIDDPRLHLNIEQRERGAWEYSPRDLALEKRLADIEKKLSIQGKGAK